MAGGRQPAIRLATRRYDGDVAVKTGGRCRTPTGMTVAGGVTIVQRSRAACDGPDDLATPGGDEVTPALPRRHRTRRPGRCGRSDRAVRPDESRVRHPAGVRA